MTSDQSPGSYDASQYPSVFVTVDLVIFTIRHGRLHVLLVERGGEPFLGHWALPGGFVEPEEDAETAAWRELAEETGVARSDFAGLGHLEQLRTYSAPHRDPRHRIVSIAHLAFAPDLPDPVAGSDAASARWWAVEELSGSAATQPPALAFDHAQILTDAVERVRSKVEYTTLATRFVAEPFTLAELRRVYQAVWGSAPDLGNFRRKVLKTPGFVEATGAKGEADASGGPRPLLYRRGDAEALHPAMLRP